MKKLSMLALFVMLAGTAFSQVSVPYGEAAGQVSFINNVKYPKIEEPVPFGPLTFRVIDTDVWVADSVAGKLLQFNKEGKLVSEVVVMPDVIKNLVPAGEKYPLLKILIEDMAPVYGEEGKLASWWVTDSMNNEVINVDLTGKHLSVIKDKDFRQLCGIKATNSGMIFVSDKAARKIFVYNAEHKRVAGLNWEWSDFAVDSADQLYRLFYDQEQRKSMLVVTTPEGKVVKTTRVEVENAMNPKLWWINETNGEAVITYTPATGFKGTYNIVRVASDGSVAASGEIVPPIAMNRFLDTYNFSTVWQAKANYGLAPEGSLEIVPFKLP